MCAISSPRFVTFRMPRAASRPSTSIAICSATTLNGKTRIRFSLMPEQVAQVVDVRTSPVNERIAAINDFVDAGYEVHINFSPVIVYDGWETDYIELFGKLDATLSATAKEQLKAEVIFLTHNRGAARSQLTLASQSRGLAVAPRAAAEKAQPKRHVEPALQSAREAPLCRIFSRHVKARLTLL